MEIWFIMVCILIDNEYASLIFSQSFFSSFFCMLIEFAKVFERKVWRVKVARLHNAVQVGIFNCQQILAKIYFVIFDFIVVKKQIDCGLPWHWWNSTHVELIDMFLTNLNADIVI